MAHICCLSNTFVFIKHTAISKDHSTMETEVLTHPTDTVTFHNTSSQEPDVKTLAMSYLMYQIGKC